MDNSNTAKALEKKALRAALIEQRNSLPDRQLRADMLQQVMRIWLIGRPDYRILAQVLVGTASVLGHCYSIYLRFGHRDFHKGSSLSEIARFYQLPASRCFAMGDGHNDLEMLDGAHAGMTACPANAVAVIREKITASGGLITRARHGAGAVEALQHFFRAR